MIAGQLMFGFLLAIIAAILVGVGGRTAISLIGRSILSGREIASVNSSCSLALTFISTPQANSETPKVNFYERLRSMQLFLQDHRVSPANMERLTQYMKCRWNHDEGNEITAIYRGLSPSLRGELAHEATGKAFEQV